MAKRASRRHVLPTTSAASIPNADAVRFDWNMVLPQDRPRDIRRVGTISAWHPRKNLGVLRDAGGIADILFSGDDVEIADRHRLEPGQAVSYVALAGPDGISARQLRLDGTTLPPPTPDVFRVKGWR